MNHEFVLETQGVRIRPITPGDAQLAVDLRGDPDLSYYIGDISSDVATQKDWLEKYLERQGDFYFVIESVRSGEPSGVIALYALNSENKDAEWGRWVIKPGAFSAAASALLIYQFAFDVLSLERIYCRTLVDNLKVLSFHDRSGASRVGIDEKVFKVRGELRDAVIHQVKRESWPTVKKTLEPFALAAQRFV